MTQPARHLRLIDGHGELKGETCSDCLAKTAQNDRLTRSFQGTIQRLHRDNEELRLKLAQLQVQVPELHEEHERIMDVLNYWRPRCKPKAVIAVNGKRYKKVADRFNDRLADRDPWTVEELKKAVDGALLSPFHCGDNEDGKKYLDAETIFRDSTTVAKHLERWEEQMDTDPNWWFVHGWDDPENYEYFLRAELSKVRWSREASTA